MSTKSNDILIVKYKYYIVVCFSLTLKLASKKQVPHCIKMKSPFVLCIDYNILSITCTAEF